MAEIETHPFKPFAPGNTTVLIIGSFPGKEPGDWFYGSKRNQFWKIISGVYETSLETREQKQTLFNKQGIGIGDLILRAKRTANNNQDENLEVVEYNDKELRDIIENPRITSIFFTSKFVEKTFRKLFPEIKTGECLPSPSPRYARMSLDEKITFYRSKLPRIN